jgi:predicted transglutaminase-like cysteine proteinase
MRQPLHLTKSLIGLLAIILCSAAGAADDRNPSPRSIDVPIVATTDRYPPYVDFCRRRPTLCQLQGAPVIPHSQRLLADLEQVSAEINRTIRFMLDSEAYSVEDFWTLPDRGYGDCEDIALAKRAQLVARGYPSAALRLAFVFDRKDLSAHCILTVETTRGTWVLDSYADAVLLWSDSPYNFEARERPDGRWDRFDQSLWHYDTTPPSGP